MSDRLLAWLLGIVTLALLVAHIAIKPGLNPKDVHDVAAMFGRPGDWTGQPAADFELPLRDGSTFRLADHVGRDVVILNFFATWCGPCRAEMPELQAYGRRHAQPGGVVLIGVDAQEPSGQVDAFVRRAGLEFPVGIDERGFVQRSYGVTAYPTTVVIGADGRIKLYQLGAIRNADVALDAVVPAEVAALARTSSDTRDAYLRAQTAEYVPSAREGFVPPSEKNAESLSGRALAIAEVMPCPCGCDDRRVLACSCRTAKAIKASLRAGVDQTLTDREVMEKLNKEFCMKGM